MKTLTNRRLAVAALLIAVVTFEPLAAGAATRFRFPPELR
jgi:hypothetical protein